jgi:hypothetical protein
MTNPTIDGEEIHVVSTKNTVVDSSTPLFSKSDRMQLSAEKRAELISKACVNVLGSNKLDLQKAEFSIETELEDTITFGTQMEHIKAQFVQYDFKDVCSIVKVDDSGEAVTDNGKIVTRDLFLHYADMTPEEVAKSNRWYREFVDQKQHPWIESNMQMASTFLAKNCSDDLWEEVNASYQQYPEVEQGGPLFLIILMHVLEKNNDTCIRGLVKGVENLRLDQIAGENVGKAARLIEGILKRLHAASSYVTADGTKIYRHIPDDFALKIIKVMQTTSVPDFNAVFKRIELDCVIAEGNGESMPKEASITNVLKLAKTHYETLVHTGDWNGVQSQGQSTFACWNCDQDGHNARDCPKPPNQERIKKHREEFRNRRGGRYTRGRGGRGGRGRGRGGAGRGRSQPPKTGMWVPPSKHEHGRRYLPTKDGWKWHKYVDNRWDVDPEHASSAPPAGWSSPAANTAAAPVAPDSITAAQGTPSDPTMGAIRPTSQLAATSVASAAEQATRAAAKRSLATNLASTVETYLDKVANP